MAMEGMNPIPGQGVRNDPPPAPEHPEPVRHPAPVAPAGGGAPEAAQAVNELVAHILQPIVRAEGQAGRPAPVNVIIINPVPHR